VRQSEPCEPCEPSRANMTEMTSFIYIKYLEQLLFDSLREASHLGHVSHLGHEQLGLAGSFRELGEVNERKEAVKGKAQIVRCDADHPDRIGDSRRNLRRGSSRRRDKA